MIVLITGASAGFGEAMARRFVAGGHRVVAAARRAERLDGLREELGEALLPLAMDVTDAASISQGLARLPAGWQPVDVLVNNAGLALGVEPAPQCSLADWTTMIDINLHEKSCII
jgi:NADP-dependent 3-hydroxy acid dehydrogenase YdfG